MIYLSDYSVFEITLFTNGGNPVPDIPPDALGILPDIIGGGGIEGGEWWWGEGGWGERPPVFTIGPFPDWTYDPVEGEWTDAILMTTGGGRLSETKLAINNQGQIYFMF